MPYRRNATTHGMSRHPFYGVWEGMKSRCKAHKDYAGRGISVCERWQKFENFRADMFAGWKPGLTVERRDNDGNYEPSNCEWATQQQQSRNKRNSLSKEIWQQLEDNLLTPAQYRSRMQAGWSEEQARSIILGGKR